MARIMSLLCLALVVAVIIPVDAVTTTSLASSAAQKTGVDLATDDKAASLVRASPSSTSPSSGMLPMMNRGTVMAMMPHAKISSSASFMDLGNGGLILAGAGGHKGQTELMHGLIPDASSMAWIVVDIILFLFIIVAFVAMDKGGKHFPPSERNESSSLAGSRQQRDVSVVEAPTRVVCWLFLSITIIIFNKALLTKGVLGFDFPYPGLLVTIHMATAVLVTECIRWTRPSLMESLERRGFRLSLHEILVKIVPVGCLLSCSVYFGNIAFLHSSVAAVQWMKGSSAAITHMFAVIMGLEEASATRGFFLTVIVAGVAVVSWGEVGFSWIGFLAQLVSMCALAGQMVMQKKLMAASGLSLDPLSTLYCFSRAGLIFVLPFAAITEAPSVEWVQAWNLLYVLLANALVAFSLNLAVLLCLQRLAATSVSILGQVKDFLLVLASSFIFAHPVSPIQWAGYAVILCGVFLHESQVLRTSSAAIKGDKSQSGMQNPFQNKA